MFRKDKANNSFWIAIGHISDVETTLFPSLMESEGIVSFLQFK